MSDERRIHSLRPPTPGTMAVATKGDGVQRMNYTCDEALLWLENFAAAASNALPS